jgi:hypothetical protein
MNIIVVCDWPSDQFQIRDAVLREAVRLALQERGRLLFLAEDAETGRSVAALRHAVKVEAAAFVENTEALPGGSSIVISAMFEQTPPEAVGMTAMFP